MRSVFFFQAEDGIRDVAVTGVQTCALPIYEWDYAGKSGISADLAAVQIVDFIEYSGNQQDFAPVDGGYVQEAEAVPF